jgi:hypothetical protein
MYTGYMKNNMRTDYMIIDMKHTLLYAARFALTVLVLAALSA